MIIILSLYYYHLIPILFFLHVFFHLFFFLFTLFFLSGTVDSDANQAQKGQAKDRQDESRVFGQLGCKETSQRDGYVWLQNAGSEWCGVYIIAKRMWTFSLPGCIC